MIEFYKVLGDTSSTYYVFKNRRWSDIYTIYETDSQGANLIGKYEYGSFHRPCGPDGNADSVSEAKPIEGASRP